MAEAKGIVKHIVIGKFKDDISAERIEELIKGYANLVNLVPTMKSFQWRGYCGEMDEAKRVVKHVVLSKYKDGVSQEKIDEIIKGYANLVNLIPQMKSFHWGKDVSTGSMNEGFTHIFESTFESVEGIAEFFAHPAHLELLTWSLPYLENVLSMDYKPTIVNL